jgi:hypothetical protein|nr:MAG TPA: hypothetical protein [Caudoviricetes sp.]
MEDTVLDQFVTIPQKEYAGLLETKADNAMLKDMLKASATLSFDGTRLMIDVGTADTLLKYILKDGYGATLEALKSERTK